MYIDWEPIRLTVKDLLFQEYLRKCEEEFRRVQEEQWIAVSKLLLPRILHLQPQGESK